MKASEMDDSSQKMLEELLNDDSDRMTAWEVEFIESLNRQRRNGMFSPKQEEVLKNIWHKVFA